MTPTTRELASACIFDALVEAGTERRSIRVEATWEQLGTDAVEILRVVEGRYGVRTRTVEVADVHTVGQAVDFVVARVAGLGRQRALAGKGHR